MQKVCCLLDVLNPDSDPDPEPKPEPDPDYEPDFDPDPDPARWLFKQDEMLLRERTWRSARLITWRETQLRRKSRRHVFFLLFQSRYKTLAK